MKTFIRKTVLTSIAILFLLGGTTAAFADSTQHLSLQSSGGVTNLATQVYTVNGGQVVYAMIDGKTVNPWSATIQYNLFATQSGLTTKGSASLQFSGKTTDGTRVGVSGSFAIDSNIPGVALPYGCSIGSTTATTTSTPCQSELPFFLTGTSSNVQLTVGTTQEVTETLNIETPYWNPFGAPIVLASADQTIVIAATYTQGTIQWIGTQVGGTMIGSLGTTTVSGALGLTTTEQEDLVRGTATDQGTMQFSSMTPKSLDGTGSYYGTSTIPRNGTLDCSGTTQIPGTCSYTGFQSRGQFTLGGISGTYYTGWSVPAYLFTAYIKATVSPSANSGQPGQFRNSFAGH